MNDTLSITQRKSLEQIRSTFKAKGIPESAIRPQILKLYAPLTSTSNTLVFSTDINQPPVVSNQVTVENRLKRDSLMFVNLFGLAVHKVAVFSTVKYPSNSPLIFYPDKNAFAAAASAPGVVAEWACLEALYNSLLTFKTNTNVRLEDYPTNIFRSVPTTQNGAAAQPGQDLALVDLNTSFYMSGQVDNKFTITLPADADRNGIAGTAAGVNYAVLLLAGFEVMEGAKSVKLTEI